MDVKPISLHTDMLVGEVGFLGFSRSGEKREYNSLHGKPGSIC